MLFRSGHVESYIELYDRQENVGLPGVQTLKPSAADRCAVLARFASATSLEEENAARDELTRVAEAGRYRPLLFAVNRPGDGFLILKNPETNRYFAFLNLVPKQSRFAKLTAAEERIGSSRVISGLVDICTGEVMEFASTTGCLVPLEFGRDYQAGEFLDRGRSLSAKLLKIEDRFELHVTFEFTAPQIAARTFMGVQRGINHLVALSVIDGDGRVLEERAIDGHALRLVQVALERRQQHLQRRGRPFRGGARRHACDEAVHTAANEVVALSLRHAAQVVIEDLSGARARRRGRGRFNRLLGRSQQHKLQRVLEYKLALAGLPRALHVHPAHTFETCPECGLRDAENRKRRLARAGLRPEIFSCVDCGHSADAHLNAARVIALKRLWRLSLSPALRALPMDQVPEPKGFAKFIRIHAQRRENRACDREIATSGREGLDGHHEDGEAPPSCIVAEPRSGSNTPAGQSAPIMLSATCPSDAIPPPAPPAPGVTRGRL